ncbi:MAG: hypothetical protein AAB971_04135 [Patescibacteria group bacterium]
MKRSEDHYQGALLEEMNERFKLIMEILVPLRDVPADIKEIKEVIAEMQADNRMFKYYMKESGGILSNHEMRLTDLEAA